MQIIVELVHHHRHHFHREIISTVVELRMLVLVDSLEDNNLQKHRYPIGGNNSDIDHRVELEIRFEDVELVGRRMAKVWMKNWLLTIDREFLE